MHSSQAARAVALGLLARREHSWVELEQKLRVRHFSQDVITKVLEKLMQQNLQSDARFAVSFARMKTGRARGPLKVVAELRSRGIDDGLIEETLAGYASEWDALALKAYMRRYEKETSVMDLREQAKRMRFLQMRGFNNEQIRYVFAVIKNKVEFD